MYTNNNNCLESDIEHFFQAIKDSDLNRFLDLLKTDININAKCGGQTALHLAIETKNWEICEKLLNCGANINAENNSHQTPLYLATMSNNTEMIDLILKFKPDPNNKNNKRSLQLLIDTCGRYWYSYQEIIDSLTKYGILPSVEELNACITNDSSYTITVLKMYLEIAKNVINSKDHLGQTPLLRACKYDNYEICELLLEHGADVNISDSELNSPLHFAVQNNNPQIIKILLEKGADITTINKCGYSVLHLALTVTNSYVIRLLCEYHPDLKNNKGNIKAFQFAILKYKNDLKILDDFLKIGYQVTTEDVENVKLLHNAATKGFSDILKVMVDYGADINVKDENGSTLLCTAVKADQMEVVQLLITHNLKIVKNNDDLLFYAVKNCNPNMLEILLKSGVKLNDKNCDDMSLLISAIISPMHKVDDYNSRVLKLVQILLNYGADVNYACTENQKSALHFAAEKFKFEDIIEILLHNKANINQRTGDGKTPLHYAVQYNSNTKLLLERGADVNCKDIWGRTPLHYAFMYGYESNEWTIRQLLELGADIDPVDSDGETPLSMAYTNGSDYAEILLQYGSDINSISEDLHYNMLYSEDACGPSPEQFFPKSAIRLKCANLYISETTLKFLNDYTRLDFQSTEENSLKYYEKQCKREIEKVKSEKIDSTDMTFYDFLQMNDNELKECLKNNNDLYEILNTGCYKKKFPIYGVVIEGKFRKVGKEIRRRKMTKIGIQILSSMSDDFLKLPYECIEKILSYLTFNELRNVNLIKL